MRKFAHNMANNDLKAANVAKKAGISAKSFDAILNGKQTLYPEDLRAICYALNVKPEKLCKRSNETRAKGKNYGT